MKQLPFIDSNGKVFYASKQSVSSRKTSFLIVKKEKKVLCLYEAKNNFYRFPSLEEAKIEQEPYAIFDVTARVWEHNEPIIEQQTYHVYVVSNADIKSTSLRWCDTDDIILGKINFDATQYTGVKNMLVRIK